MHEQALYDRCLGIAAGNESAALFLHNTSRIIRLADDIADGDSLDPVTDMADVLMRAMCINAANPFFQQHSAALSVVLANGIVLWKKSEDWKRSENRKTRMFGFVLRDAIENIYITTALICGGYEHSVAVAEQIQVVGHEAESETFEEWEEE